eukprot:7411724-Prorocentrum_lima.AAC.1
MCIRDRDDIVGAAKGMVPSATYLAFTLPEMEIKANQVHTVTMMCKEFMSVLERFYESLHDQ